MTRVLTIGLVVFIWLALAVAVWFEWDFRRGLDDRRSRRDARFARRHRCHVDPPRINTVRRDPSPRPRERGAV